LKLPVTAILIAILVHILWGANPVAVKMGLEVFPPFWSGFVRFGIGIACIATWAWIKGVPLWPKRHEWAPLFPLSILFFVQISVMNIGFGMSSGAVGSIITSTYPMFAAVTAHFMLKDDRLSVMKSLGLTVAFVGVSVVIAGDIDFDAMHWLGLGSVVVLCHAAMLGFRMIYSAKLVRQIDPVRVMSWQMILSLPAFALSGALVETIAWQNMAWQPVVALLYQGIVIAGFGFMINAILMQKYSPTLMLSFGFVSPISGVMLSLWLLGETLSWQVVVGMLLVAFGLYVIAKGKNKEVGI
jgi:drug/metabolite transporter (DMT)-like permease